MKNMKNKFLLAIAMVFALGPVALAAPTLYSETVGVWEYIWDTPFGSFNPDATWSHSNPFVGDYDAAVAAGEITDVSLTIEVAFLEASDDV